MTQTFLAWCRPSGHGRWINVHCGDHDSCRAAISAYAVAQGWLSVDSLLTLPNVDPNKGRRTRR